MDDLEALAAAAQTHIPYANKAKNTRPTLAPPRTPSTTAPTPQRQTTTLTYRPPTTRTVTADQYTAGQLVRAGFFLGIGLAFAAPAVWLAIVLAIGFVTTLVSAIGLTALKLGHP